MDNTLIKSIFISKIVENNFSVRKQPTATKYISRVKLGGKGKFYSTIFPIAGI
jgi:hypothetical protein